MVHFTLFIPQPNFDAAEVQFMMTTKPGKELYLVKNLGNNDWSKTTQVCLR